MGSRHITLPITHENVALGEDRPRLIWTLNEGLINLTKGGEALSSLT